MTAANEISFVLSCLTLLLNLGNFHYRNNGEAHLNTPEGMVSLQQATRLNSTATFKQYTRHIDKMNKAVTLRGVLKFKSNIPGGIELKEDHFAIFCHRMLFESFCESM